MEGLLVVVGGYVGHWEVVENVGAVDVCRRRDVEVGEALVICSGETIWSEMVFSNNGQYDRSLVVVPDLHDSEHEHIPSLVTWKTSHGLDSMAPESEIVGSSWCWKNH
jgi:hypothetical protein